MAQGLVNHDLRELWEAESAGVVASGVNPWAVEVLLELGIDISHHTSKTIDTVFDLPFDLVVTVCDHAKEFCPVFPGATALHHMPVPDPVYATNFPEEEAMRAFRDVRDQIRERLIPLLQDYYPSKR